MNTLWPPPRRRLPDGLFPSRLAPPSPPPSGTLFLWLIFGFALALLPHFSEIPFWMMSLMGATLVLRVYFQWRHLRLPNGWLCAALALGLVALVAFTFHTVVGRDAGLTLVIGLLGIKFFELHGHREVALLIFCSFFVIVSALLYSQSIEFFFYDLVLIWLLTGVLIRTYAGDRPEQRFLPLLRLSTVLFLQALPLALALFFFLPRYHGKLQLPMHDTQLGLTDTVEPGSISRLMDDDSTAMRVIFTQGDVPLPGSLYWRALLLWDCRHNTWTQGKPVREGPPVRVGDWKNLVTQQITIWPHFHRWLFALDQPVTAAQNSSAGSTWCLPPRGGVLQLSNSRETVNAKEEYTVTSASDVHEEALKEEIRRRGLELPWGEIDPRVIALAEDLRRKNPRDQDFIRSVLVYFRQQHFVYSRMPGSYGKNELADFLFQRKSGFCEHYASAFAILMRLGQLPCRLVVGYVGANFNPYGNFYIIPQSYAHVWNEVWLDQDKKWERIDPTTALVSTDPEQAASPLDQTDFSFRIASQRLVLLPANQIPDWMKHALHEFELRREELEADWDTWVLSYDADAQDHLMEKLGLTRAIPLSLFLICAGAFLLSAAGCWFFLLRKRKDKPAEEIYLKLCRRLARRGFPRQRWEGPLGYMRRLSEAWPERAAPLQELGRLIAQDRYSRISLDAAALQRLHTLPEAILAPSSP